MMCTMDSMSEVHDLLDPLSVVYSNMTVQRAFIAWTHLGHTNTFKEVCNYYHYLEALEETMTPEGRRISRHCEYNLLSAHPPSSPYLLENYPNLYPKTMVEILCPEELRKANDERSAPKHPGLCNGKGTSTEEILSTSQMIRNYCMTHQITLRQFLVEFKAYASKLDINPTVTNVAFYLKHRKVVEERELETNIARNTYFTRTPSPEDKGRNSPNVDIETIVDNYNKMAANIDKVKRHFEENPKEIDVNKIVKNIFEADCQRVNVKIEKMRFQSESNNIDDVLHEISELVIERNSEDQESLIGSSSGNSKSSVIQADNDDSNQTTLINEPHNGFMNGTISNTAINFSANNNEITYPDLETIEPFINSLKKTACSVNVKISTLKEKTKRNSKKARDSRRINDNNINSKITKKEANSSCINAHKAGPDDSTNLIDFESSTVNADNFGHNFKN